MSNGEGQGCKVAKKNKGFVGCLVFAKWRSWGFGFKNGEHGDLSFSHSVQNGFGCEKWFRTTCEIVLGLRKFSHSLRKFRRVFEMISQGVFIFAGCAKWVRKMCEISHPM